MKVTKEHIINVFKEYIEVIKKNDIRGFKDEEPASVLRSDFLSSVLNSLLSDLNQARLISTEDYDNLYDEFLVNNKLLRKLCPESLFNNAVSIVDDLQSFHIYGFRIEENEEVFNESQLLDLEDVVVFSIG